MFFEQTKDQEKKLENALAKHESDLQKLMIRMDGLDREYRLMMEELKVTPEQISIFVANPDNFTDENWEELQKNRKEIEQKFDCSLKNIPDPKAAKKAASQRQVQPHWMFVR